MKAMRALGAAALRRPSRMGAALPRPQTQMPMAPPSSPALSCRPAAKVCRWLRPVGAVQQQLARCLADTQSRSSSSVSLVSRFFRRAFDLATPRLATGVAAEADSLRTNRQTLIGLTQEVAATVYQCAAMSTNTVLQRLMTAIQTGSRPLVAFTSLCFDETPVWLHVGETGQASSSEVQAAIKRTLENRRKSAAAPTPRGGTSKPKVVARIFQVDAQCAFLMRH